MQTEVFSIQKEGRFTVNLFNDPYCESMYRFTSRLNGWPIGTPNAAPADAFMIGDAASNFDSFKGFADRLLMRAIRAYRLEGRKDFFNADRGSVGVELALILALLVPPTLFGAVEMADALALWVADLRAAIVEGQAVLAALP
jgi:hypothetical protein